MQLTARSFSLQTSSRLLKHKPLLSDSNMALGLFGRLSWICVLISSGACFPATKGDYRYPYTATWGSAGGPAPGSNLQPEGSRSPGASSLSLGYVSPPVGTGKKTPSFPTQLQPVAGTSGGSNLGSVYEAPHPGFAYPAANTATAYGSGPSSAYGSGPSSAYGSGPSSAYGSGPSSAYGSGPSSAYGSGPSSAYGSGPSSGYNVAPLPYDNSGSPGLPWVGQPAGGADASSYDPSNWMPSRPFPDLSVWDSGNQMSQGASETSPLPPSSYIVQSRNGYLRAREALSHTNYSPEYPQPPVYSSKTVKAPSKSAPATGPKGGHGVPLG